MPDERASAGERGWPLHFRGGLGEPSESRDGFWVCTPGSGVGYLAYTLSVTTTGGG